MSSVVAATAVVMVMMISMTADVAQGISINCPFKTCSPPTPPPIRVGGSSGWSPAVVNSWKPNHKFVVGDVLLFAYDKNRYNVCPVDEAGYNRCGSEGSCMNTGNDSVTLTRKGLNYFISDYPGACQAGVKIAVNVK